MINNKRGFTLIELLIVLGISAIIISVVSMFFINNARSFDRIDTDTELQYQAQFISNFVLEKMQKSTGIEKVSRNNGTIYKIAINNNDTGDKDYKAYTLFELKNGDEIFYTQTNNINGRPTTVLGKYIIQMNIVSVPKETKYSEAKCIKIEFFFEKDKQTYQIEQTVFFRNSN